MKIKWPGEKKLAKNYEDFFCQVSSFQKKKLKLFATFYSPKNKSEQKTLSMNKNKNVKANFHVLKMAL